MGWIGEKGKEIQKQRPFHGYIYFQQSVQIFNKYKHGVGWGLKVTPVCWLYNDAYNDALTNNNNKKTLKFLINHLKLNLYIFS